MTPLHDAHNHLQDSRLADWRARAFASYAENVDGRAVVNGTCETDWEQVAELAETHGWIHPSFGLHPWRLAGRSPQWMEQLGTWLDRFPAAAVGEIGLDRWMDDPDIDAQLECFQKQMRRAAADNRAATVHCLKAIGLLEETTRDLPLPKRGWLLHSYNGPPEMVPQWVERGAYFSISPYFAHERKSKQLDTFRAVPRERLLIETDAPSMWPPDEANPHPLTTAEGEPINHPANLEVSFRLAMQVTGWTETEAREQLAENFHRLFGADSHTQTEG